MPSSTTTSSERWRAALAVFALAGSIANADDTRELFRDIAHQLRAANATAAAVVLITPQEPPEVWTYGEGISASTPFRWGSITKTFTALTLMTAAERKGIPMSTPLADVVSPVVWHNPFETPIRLSQLPALRAGMTDLTGRAFADNSRYALREAVAVHSDSLQVHWLPGRFHSYSNATPGLSQLAIESLTGKPFDDALRKLVLRPLGMKSATVLPLEDAAALKDSPNALKDSLNRRATRIPYEDSLPGGFRPDGKTEIPYWNMTFAAFGALNASAEEMQQFLTALLAGGLHDGKRVWSKTSHAAMVQPAEGFAVGYGAGVYTRVRAGLLWHTHGGDADGYRSRYAALLDAKRGYVVVINVDNPSALRAIEQRLESFLASAVEPGARAEHAHLPQDIAAPWLGTYYPATVRFGVDAWRSGTQPKLQLRWRRGNLIADYRGRSTTLYWLGEQSFRRRSDPGTSFRLTHQGGKRWIEGELGNFALQAPATPN